MSQPTRLGAGATENVYKLDSIKKGGKTNNSLVDHGNQKHHAVTSQRRANPHVIFFPTQGLKWANRSVSTTGRTNKGSRSAHTNTPEVGGNMEGTQSKGQHKQHRNRNAG